MSKATDLVKAIGEQAMEELYTSDKYEIEYDEGFCSASVHASFGYEYGNGYCDIGVFASWAARHDGWLEVEISGVESVSTANIPDCKKRVYKKLDRLCDAVSDYIKEKIDMELLLDGIEESYQNDCYDEWNDHGFRDAADYYSWRYG